MASEGSPHFTDECGIFPASKQSLTFNRTWSSCQCQNKPLVSENKIFKWLYNLLFKFDIILPFLGINYIYFVVVDCCWAILVATVQDPTQPLKILSTQQLIDDCKPNELDEYAYSVDVALLYIERNDILEKKNL